jgi:short-subunit dehydrogenase
MIIITGATKGIGRAIANKFASKGFDLAVCARKSDELSHMKETLETAYPIKVHTFQADVSKKEEVQHFATFLLGLNTTIDALVNNAGVFLPGAIHSEAEGVIEQLIETNLYSAYYLTRHLATRLISQKRGHIFNICSIASFEAYPNGGSYAISKHALYGFSKCLREELKPHQVKVTHVMPGATLTASWDGIDLPADRFSKPEDVADIIYACYQLSPQSVIEDLVIRPILGDI